MSGEYLIGRRAGTLDPGRSEYSDVVFSADRFDGQVFLSLRFQHSTFANNSFKQVRMDGCRFENVVFIGGYFRDTMISNTEFSACKFINCNFSRVDMRSVGLKYYNSFDRTFIPFDRVHESLPSEGNLRQQLCTSLERQAIAIGEYRDAGLFREEAIKGERSFLIEVILRRTPYYKNKYDATDSLRSVAKLVQLTFFDAVWGRRKSYLTILQNWLLLAILVAVCTSSLGRTHLGSGVSRWQAGVFGFFSVFPVIPLTDYPIDRLWLSILIMCARLTGLLLSGLFITLVFSRVYEGRR